MKSPAVLVLVLLASACTADGHELLVDVRTDLRPTVEFAAINVNLTRGASSADIVGVVGQMAQRSVAGDEAFLDGVRSAELTNVEPGSYVLTVQLADSTGRPIASRIVHVDMRDNLALTVVITRDCRDVSCPGPGNPTQAVSCVGGRCEDPGCAATDDCLPPECEADTDCPAANACTSTLCVEGTCFYAANDGACATGQACIAEVGCVDVDDMDGGVGDAGPTDGATDTISDTEPPVDSGPSGPTATMAPRVVDHAGGFGVTWIEPVSQEVWLTLYDGAGDATSAPTPISDSGGLARSPTIASTGTQLGIAWSDTRASEQAVYFARADASGAKIGSDVRVSYTTGGGHSPVIGWNGAEFAVAWKEQTSPYSGILHFDRVRPDGTLVGDPVAVYGENSPLPIQMIWTGGEYGVLFSTSVSLLVRELRIGRVGSDGRMSSDNLLWTARGASVDWTGGGYGIAWYESELMGSAELFFARTDSRGRRMGSSTLLASEPPEISGIAIAWDGVGFAALYRDDATSTLRLFPLDATGGAGASRVVSSAGEEVGSFAIAASGSVLGIAYVRTVAGDSDVAFTTTAL